ncbi:MAG: hypothetical protein HFG05_10165 [Oscillibacter sp.]|nr:hypothetical protein [Oscillibacter sp.]
MSPETNHHKLTRWLLIATVALLAAVLGLQLWQMFRPPEITREGSLTQDADTERLNPAGDNVTPGKTAMIEDVRSLNPALDFDDLAVLSVQELEQLQRAGAPGLPVGAALAVHMAETYAGTLEISSVTGEADPNLEADPAHYGVALHHPTLGDFQYKIDAYTGEVLEGVPNILESAPAPETKTGEDAAKAVAFAHAGVDPADVTALRCELGWDGGRQVYDVEFWAEGTEYEYEIDASSNRIIEAELDREGALESGELISPEAAKNAALAHAGVSEAGYIECELDQDDGLWVYEIEFRSGGMEYEYEIDASSGTVMEAEMER